MSMSGEENSDNDVNSENGAGKTGRMVMAMMLLLLLLEVMMWTRVRMVGTAVGDCGGDYERHCQS